MNSEELKKIIENATVEIDEKQKLPCARAHKLAEKNNISLKEIGDCCNDNDIKISSCQLGCFQ